MIKDDAGNYVDSRWTLLGREHARKEGEKELKSGMKEGGPMLTKIYLDMDGVLASFVGGFTELVGMGPSEYENIHGTDRMWERVYETPNFFADLPLMQYTYATVSLCQLNAGAVTILSSPSRVNKPLCMLQKRQWIDEHLGKRFPAIFTSKKHTYAGPDRLLIDDQARNIDAWEEAGGVGIVFKNYHQLLAEFEKRGYVN